MSEFRTIKELVIAACQSEGGFPSYDTLTSLVRRHFPSSKWQKTHYAWYKSKIKGGGIEVPGLTLDPISVAENEDADTEAEEAVEASISLERDLHAYLACRLHEVEHGLELVPGGIEYQTPAGRIDLLARDAAGVLVVVELKAGKAKDAALGQLLGYMGSLCDRELNLRGILVASDFDQRVVLAAKGLPNVKLVKYQLLFAFRDIDASGRGASGDAALELPQEQVCGEEGATNA